jgi:hypothetical protein
MKLIFKFVQAQIRDQPLQLRIILLTATSILRGGFTPYYGSYFLPCPIGAPCPVLSYTLVQIKPGTPELAHELP